MAPKEFIFWHNVVSPHAAPLVQEVAEAGCLSFYVSFDEMTLDRRRLGWSVPEVSPATLMVRPDERDVAALIKESSVDAVHVIAGARVNSWGSIVARLCRSHNRRFGIISESPDPRGIAGVLRKVKYSIERRTIGGNFEFVLAMGQKGCRWFKNCGYPSEIVFPFAYTPDFSCLSEVTAPRKRTRVTFVGQLIPRKGVDLLLTSFASLGPNADVELMIVGSGPMERTYREQAERLSVSSRVTWTGAVPNHEAANLISNSDLLVLPSREDGWGAVVNEALMVGTPVICSSACGAADLVREPCRGAVFRSDSVTDLAAALASWTGVAPARGEAEREAIRTWAKCISKTSLAAYFMEVMAHVYGGSSRPEAPWEYKC